VGFEASVRIPFLVSFMVHYYKRYKIILTVISEMVIIMASHYYLCKSKTHVDPTLKK
jgi:hypothetical protein